MRGSFAGRGSRVGTGLMFEWTLQVVTVFVLVFFRLAGMTLFAPLFGSAKIPRRVKLLLVLVLAFGMTSTVKRPPVLPVSTWELAVGIGGEMVFGLAMGMVMSFVFIAAQWGGEIIGQQMGFNLSEVFDPQFGSQGSLIGDAYFMLTLVVFLAVGGHRAMLQGVHASFEALPLLSVGMDEPLLRKLADLMMGATVLAIQLAAPMLVTMLIVDLVLGLIGKTMPQMNVMAAGLSMRSALGMLVLIVGLGLSVQVIRASVLDSIVAVWDGWTTPAERVLQ
ncbi:MAG: fliR: flagellar biosynthetic protein FliR [Phycisphaerales bacterium]|nr:fliR: flagellar biosynthetic protein FliR [Phycisphaerales bacterium]MDB5299874.1 fliR: flagellar biosynthetic protein FliR [Phycisphaerales bacterium]